MVPSQQKPGLFSAGEPASVFYRNAGVVAGTGSLIMRRWNGGGGGGETDSCGVVSGSLRFKLVSRILLKMRTSLLLVPENDFNDAQVVVLGSYKAGAGFSCNLQRMPHARCVVNSVGDTEDGDNASVYLGEQQGH